MYDATMAKKKAKAAKAKPVKAKPVKRKREKPVAREPDPGEPRNSPDSMIMGIKLRSGDAEALKKAEDALRAEQGNVFNASGRLGVPHRTFMNWRKQCPELEKLVEKVRAEHA